MGGLPRFDHLPGQPVGVDHHRAALGQQPGHGRLPAPDPPGEADDDHRGTVSSAPIAPDPRLWSADPVERLEATRAPGRGAHKALLRRAAEWPPYSPGALNAWLLLVTTKPPTWRDPLVQWRELPLTLGEPHEGFFYPDPLGFWGEVRRWATELLRRFLPGATFAEALSLSMLVHLADEPARLDRARHLARPRLVLFLDEPAWEASAMTVADRRSFRVPDPHRPRQEYEGFWARLEDGTTVGKSPQHPAAHRLYRPADLSEFLGAAPVELD